MFSYDGGNLPSIRYYARALEVWTKAKTWRNKTDVLDERKLDGNKSHVAIRKTADGTIHCRLHHTDVVTYTPDGRLILIPYGSTSTDEFANRLLQGTNITASFNCGYVHVSDRIYTTYKSLELKHTQDGSYELVSTPEPWERYIINRARSAKLLKENDYKAFSNWLRVIAGMGEGVNTNRRYLEFGDLRDRSMWPDLIQVGTEWSSSGRRNFVNVKGTLDRVRTALYKANPDVYDVETKPYLESWKEVNNWKKHAYR